jgi:hypothetical protein
MSEWRAAVNRKALARLDKALPAIFPQGVLIHALQRRFMPPMPRLAVDSYWRAHPVRADRLARALAGRSGAPAGWRWRLFSGGATSHARHYDFAGRTGAGLMRGGLSLRTPPAPYREPRHALGPGFCCVCGQPVYRFGWHVDLWGGGANMNATWHAACVVAWDLWTAPSGHAAVLKRLQRRRCELTGGRLWRTAEVDHRVPLFRVWREHRDLAWPLLLRYWGVPNLRVLSRPRYGRRAKTADDGRSAGAGCSGGACRPHSRRPLEFGHRRRPRFSCRCPFRAGIRLDSYQLLPLRKSAPPRPRKERHVERPPIRRPGRTL